MRKKILALTLALAIAAPVLALASNDDGENNNGGTESTTFSVTSVSPSTIENYQANDITITGTGFNSISHVGAHLGKFEDDEKDDTDDTGTLNNVTVVNDATITATIPAEADAGDMKSITVVDTGATPNTYFTLLDALTIHPSFEVNDRDGDNDGIVEVYQTNSKNAQAVFNLDVAGQSYKNKKWLKVRVGSKKGVISKVSRTGGNSIVSVKFKYGKMAAGNYDISLTYKNGLKKAVTRNGKTKYKTIWESGTMGNGNAFSVLLQPMVD
ncbi:MAG: IPT/TIG domain-containing protein [Candidatus Moranbacteria bacterium]|nr:IPT/TIG domain-containing protein [Candidatus Moranbacteria bacterium]